MLLALLLAGSTPGEALAHRLNVDLIPLRNHQFQVEGWFSTGEAARGARVQVFTGDSQLSAEGKMDDQGIFIFALDKAAALRIVVTAGSDHPPVQLKRTEDETRQLLLASGGTAAGAPAASADTFRPAPLADRGSGVTIKDVLIGIGFVLGLAAFLLSMRNARLLRELRQRRQS